MNGGPVIFSKLSVGGLCCHCVSRITIILLHIKRENISLDFPCTFTECQSKSHRVRRSASESQGRSWPRSKAVFGYPALADSRTLSCFDDDATAPLIATPIITAPSSQQPKR